MFIPIKNNFMLINFSFFSVNFCMIAHAYLNYAHARALLHTQRRGTCTHAQGPYRRLPFAGAPGRGGAREPRIKRDTHRSRVVAAGWRNKRGNQTQISQLIQQIASWWSAKLLTTGLGGWERRWGRASEGSRRPPPPWESSAARGTPTAPTSISIMQIRREND